MRDFWWQLTVSTGSPVAWVLDASEEAVDAWPRAVELVSRLLRRLPADREAEFYFLGNSASYKSSEFSTMAARWAQENRPRGRLVSPVMEQLQTKINTTIVIMAAICPFDLADWSDSPLLDRVYFVSLSETPIHGFPGRDCPADADQLWQRLQQRIASVELTLDSSIPISWDNAAYEWTGQRLVAREATDFSIKMGWMSDVDQPPVAVATWSNGSQHQLVSPQPCEPLNPTGWLTLYDDEAAAFRDAVAGYDFDCPVCGRKHSPDQLKCKPSLGAPGIPIYCRDELTRYRGFVVLRDLGASVECRAHRRSVLQIDHERVATIHEGRAVLQRFNARTRKWIDEGEFSQYQTVEGVGHAIFL